jgi:serine/threonine protein kinase
VIDHLRDRLVAAVGDHYLIEAELGRGGMAAVFQALDLRLNRRVAIKVLPPDLAFNPGVRSRFLREAQMAAALTHPNIVPIYTVDEVERMVFFVMALVEGESVSARLRREGALPVEEARGIVAQVADALDFAHKQGVIHRDIKPDNILLDRASKRPMVTDFGIARAAAEEQRLTVTGMAVGTPAYMSPEQAMGDRDVDGRSDIYSLGIVAYQMLAGETPFKATNTPAMLMKHVSEPPPPLRGRRHDLPSGFASAVERALAKRPEDRFRSGAEMRDAVLDRTTAREHVAAPQQHSAPIVQRDAIPEPPRRFPPGYPRPLAPIPAPAPAPPVGLSRQDRKEWYRDQRDAYREAVRLDSESPEGRIARKISRFRKSLFTLTAVGFMLFVINAAAGGDVWFIFPVLAFMVALASQAGSLWADGVPFSQVLKGAVRQPQLPAPPAPSGPPLDHVSELAARDVLEGMHGGAIKRAAEARRVISDMLRRTTPKEREMLPVDLEATVNALVDRVASVAVTLHRLDTDANGTSLGSLDKRIEALKLEMETPERERRLALLERQRSTLHDLMERRTALLSQLESASLALDNLKLDMVRFRSAGVSSALEDVTSATREARAVSRDIGHLLDAQDEMKKL